MNGVTFIRNLRFLPHILKPREWRMIVILTGIVVLSGCALLLALFGYRVITVPDSGGTYAEGIVGIPSRINPLFAFRNTPDIDVTRLVFSGLVRVNAQQKIVPDLAEQFTISPDKRTYTFRLRDNAVWHDGVSVTADDILFTYNRVQDPELFSPLARQFEGITVTKIDDTTIQFTLREAFAPFLESLTLGILPKHIWGDVPAATAAHAEFNVRPIGSGPYAFSTLVRDKRGVIKAYTLKSFDAYYADRPFISTLQLRFYETAIDAVAALERGEIHGLGLLPSRDLVLPDATETTTYPLPLSQYTALFFNGERQSILKDRKVREALAHAIDRDALIDSILQGAGTPIASPILLGALGFTTDVNAYPLDRERAEALLDEAKWARITPEEFLEREEAARATLEEAVEEKTDDGTTLSLRELDATATEDTEETVPIIHDDTRILPYYRKSGDAILTIHLTTADVPENRAAAELVQEAWEAIGVRTILDIRSENIQQVVIGPRAYDVLLFGIRLGRDPDPFAFWHSSQTEGAGANLSLYKNTKVDGLLEDARRTDDPEIRAAKYAEFQEIVTKDLPAHFLYTPTYLYMIDPRVEGFSSLRIAKPTDRFADIDSWFLKTQWKLIREK